MRHAEPLSPGLFVVVQIDTDDHIGPGQLQPLNDVQPDAAQTENHGLGTDFHLGRVDHRNNAGGNTAACLLYTSRCV